MRVEGAQGAGPGLDLRTAEIGGIEGDLALEIGQGDRVVVDQSQRADAGRRALSGGGGPDSAQADQPHARGLQTLLPRPADLGQHQMAGIAFDFIVGEGHGPS